MVSPAFAELVGKLVEAMGQTLTAIRPVAEGLLLRTTDGFVYAFLEDPTEVSLVSLERLYGEAGGGAPRIVLLTPGRLPLALSAEVARRGSTLIDGARFHELARSLGLESYLGEEPRAPPHGERSRLLPSALQLDSIMSRGRAWLEWGVPALALRFYRQAMDLKPGFAPAKVGAGKALLALGLIDDADRVIDEVLHERPDDWGAQLGKAAILGAKGRPKEEVDLYRKLLREDPSRAEVRAHLVAALIDLPDWPAARDELANMVRATPEDPRLRYLYGVALAKTGRATNAEREWQHARDLGLTLDSERALASHIGWTPSVATATGPATSSRRGGAREPKIKDSSRTRLGSSGSRRSRNSGEKTHKGSRTKRADARRKPK